MNHDIYRTYLDAAAWCTPARSAMLAAIQTWRPFGDALPGSDAAAAALELLASLQVSGDAPPFVLGGAPAADGDFSAVRQEVVLRLPFCNLVRFRRQQDLPRPKILLVAPLSGHHASRLRDTVGALLGGHDVFVTDWRNARDVPVAAGRFDIDDYLEYLLVFLREIGPGVHLAGICQSCPPVLAAAALLAEDGDPATPRSLILMCGPVDPRINATFTGLAARAAPLALFEQAMTATIPGEFAGAGRRVAPGFLQAACLLGADAPGRMAALLQTCAGLGVLDRAGLEEARRCYQDELSLVDLPAEFYLSTIDRVFRQAALPRGRFSWRGRPVRLAAIRDTALMTIEGADDAICGAGQTHAAHALCAGISDALRVCHTEPATGHAALFSGARWRSGVHPAVRAFVAAQERRMSGGCAASPGVRTCAQENEMLRP
ncbi:MAG TPA: polyhydroxyalkanoate depolymerase [Noviherbaspirillum sp.]|jgi:polyhydroxyalkanoate depolymerase|uniref:polyhydroxyalkanoate depolymerase n=1 Tax=Noviherbaspirillum sp. TaxID=1926288 RepID=UPI002F95150D